MVVSSLCVCKVVSTTPSIAPLSLRSQRRVSPVKSVALSYCSHGLHGSARLLNLFLVIEHHAWRSDALGFAAAHNRSTYLLPTRNNEETESGRGTTVSVVSNKEWEWRVEGRNASEIPLHWCADTARILTDGLRYRIEFSSCKGKKGGEGQRGRTHIFKM